MVAGQSSGQSPVSIAYQAPVIYTVSVAGGQIMQTPGGETVTLTGNSYGPVGTLVSDIVVKYGIPGVLEFTATGCSVTVAHVTMVCTTVTGVGASHVWWVSIRNVSSPWTGGASINTSYALSNVTGIGAGSLTVLDTAGGQTVLLAGTNFGPIATFNTLRGFFRNSQGSGWQAQSCVVITPSTLVQCTMVGGVGYGLQWLIEVSGRNGSAWSTNTSSMTYATPVITGQVSPLTLLSTTGGTVVGLVGQYFGPTSAGVITAYYTGGSTGLLYNATSCVVVVPQSQINCTTIVGVGYGYGWGMSIAGVWSAFTYAATNTYVGPYITNVTVINGTGYMQTNGTSFVRITGYNFGVVGGVPVSGFYGVLGAANTSSYAASSCNVTVSVTEITCRSVVGIGSGLYWTVMVAGQSSGQSPVSVSYQPPSIWNVSTILYRTIGA